MSRPRPGTALTEDEVIWSLLCGVVDDLESFQTPHLHPNVESALADVRFCRDLLAKRGFPIKYPIK